LLSVATATIALLGTTAAPCTSLAQVRKTKDGYLFRMMWKKGDVYEYAMTSATEMTPGNPFEFTMEYSMTVLDVKDEIAEVAMSMSNPMAKETMEMTLKMNDREIADTEMAAAMTMGSGQFGFQYPEKPLKIGESWKADQPMGLPGTEMVVQTTYTFEGLEIVDEVSCARVTVKTSVEMSGEMKMSLNSEGVIYVENKTGQLFKSTIDTTTEIDMNGRIMKMPSTIEIKRK